MGMVWEFYHKGVPLLGVPETGSGYISGRVFFRVGGGQDTNSFHFCTIFSMTGLDWKNPLFFSFCVPLGGSSQLVSG